jgi:hypothetical protein
MFAIPGKHNDTSVMAIVKRDADNVVTHEGGIVNIIMLLADIEKRTGTS